MSDGGNPLLSQPPTDVNVGDVAQHEIDPRKRAELEALGRKDAGEHHGFWAGLWASILWGISFIASDFANALDEVLAFVGKFFLLGQGEKNASFYDLAGTILEDLTGVPVDKAALKNSAFGSGRLAAMTTYGADLYNLLAKEFAPQSGNLEEGDVKPAETFLGFLMNFAIRQGNIELLTSMLPESWRVGEGFRAYGELMARNLGLGRMARRALQPLIATLVADPLQYQLNQQYRPKRMAKEQAIKAYFRQVLDLSALRKELAQEGYSDARQDFMIDDSRPLVGDRELIKLMFRGQIADPDFTKEISARGYDANGQFLLIEGERPFLEKNEIALLYVNDKIDRDTALDLLKRLGFSDANDLSNGLSTASLVLDAHSLSHAHAHRLGLGVLRKMLHDGVIDVLEFGAHLAAQGYSADDINLLQLEFLQPTDRQVRQLSLAEIKAGFKAGALTEPQAAQHLKTLGYSDTDVEVILKSLPTGKKPAAPATPAG
jgi:hypothetical protein